MVKPLARSGACGGSGGRPNGDDSSPPPPYTASLSCGRLAKEGLRRVLDGDGVVGGLPRSPGAQRQDGPVDPGMLTGSWCGTSTGRGGREGVSGRLQLTRPGGHTDCGRSSRSRAGPPTGGESEHPSGTRAAGGTRGMKAVASGAQCGGGHGWSAPTWGVSSPLKCHDVGGRSSDALSSSVPAGGGLEAAGRGRAPTVMTLASGSCWPPGGGHSTPA
mmetsp:Transcript_12937/g.27312  ORF Transcript_12937/g.27312 Transcript_12937/m.27312 type:complete len:217 (-) Transcript_12937:529-1179(-)